MLQRLKTLYKRLPAAVTEIALFMGGDTFGKLLALFTTVYLARILGPVSFGKMTVGQTIVVYLSLIADGGLARYEARLLAQAHTQPEVVSRRLTIATYGRIVMTVVVLILYLLITSLLPIEPITKNVMLLSSLWMIGVITNMEWFWQGLHKTWVVGIIRIVYPLLYLITILILVHEGEDLYTAVVLKAVAFIGTGVFFLVVALLYLRRQKAPLYLRIPHTEVVKDIRQSFPLLITGVLISFYSSNLDLIALQLWRPPEEAGMYAAAYRLYQPVLAVSGMIVYFWYPRLCNSITLEDSRKNGIRRQFAVSSLAVVLPCSMLLAFGGPIAYSILYGPSYAGGAPILSIFALGPLFSIFGGYFVTQLTAYGYFVDLQKIYLCGALAILIGDILLVPGAGMYGAAFSTVLAEVAVMTAGSWYLIKHRKGSWQQLFKEIQPLWLACIPLLAGIALSIVFGGSSLLTIVVLGVSILLYAAIAYTALMKTRLPQLAR